MRKRDAWQVIAALVLAGSSWFYFDCLLVPYQKRDAVDHQRPRGNSSDLYPRWLGARELLLHGRNPYSDEISREAQLVYYGRVLDPSRPNDPTDQQGFAYPVYVVFLLAPTIFLPFTTVQSGYVALLWLVSAASVRLWLKALRWHPPGSTVLALLVLSLSSFPFVQAIKVQQLTLLVAGLLAAAIAALSAGYLTLAGFLLAVCTIKPQLIGLVVLWALAWAAVDWPRRQRLCWSFGITMAALLVGAHLILPGWLGDFWQAIHKYHEYTHNQSILSWLFTPLWGNLLALFLVGYSAWQCRMKLRAAAGSEDFLDAFTLVIALTLAVIPTTAHYNQFLLLPVMLFLARQTPSPARTPYKILRFCSFALMIWPWIASLGLMLASFVVPYIQLQNLWKLPFGASFPFPLFVFATMAWRTATADREPKRTK